MIKIIMYLSRIVSVSESITASFRGTLLVRVLLPPPDAHKHARAQTDTLGETVRARTTHSDLG